MSKFNFVVNIEVAEDKGEDANLAQDFGKTFLMGVFDGLGGRSAGFDGKTGGRIASRIASQTTKTFLNQYNGKITAKNAVELQQQIYRSLQQSADTYLPKVSSRLKGSLMGHRLCTTIALASIPKQQTQAKKFEANLAWMGDSRIYFLSPTKGLQQLTKDDLVSPKDALEMLSQDPPMSQYLSADLDPKWRIHFQQYNMEEIGCFLACTDGCFQYVSAPWDFEKLLLEALMDSEGDRIDNNNWYSLISHKYNQIKQDDVSLVLYPIGFSGIKQLKKSYSDRFNYLQGDIFTTTSTYDQKQRLWNQYRINYEYYLQFIEEVKQSEVVHQMPIKDVPNSSTTLNLFQGLTKVFRGKAEEKAEEIQKLLDEANRCYEKNELKQAQDLCSQVLELDFNCIYARELLGFIHTELGFQEKDYYKKNDYLKYAINYFSKVIEKDGVSIEVYRTLGFVNKELNDWKTSVYYYHSAFSAFLKEQQTIEGWEKHLDAFGVSLGLYQVHPDNQYVCTAINFCKQLQRRLPHQNKGYTYYYIGVIQEIKGDLPLALEHIRSAIELYQRYPSIVPHDRVQKAQQKCREIQNKLSNTRRY